MADPIRFFDCNVSFGSPMGGVFCPCPTVSELLAELDWAGIERALVHHTLMREQSPTVGNAVLAAEIADQSRLVGSWAILPPQTEEIAPAPIFFRQMAAANVRALWAFPLEHRYLLDRLTFGCFLDEVSERRIPLFLPRDSIGTQPGDAWALAYRLLEQYPRLRLVMATHGPWGEDRYFRALLEHYRDFYLDISRYELDCGLRELTRRYGHERLLYGSNFPRTYMGGPRLMVAQAEISDEAKIAIAGANLERILGEVELG